MFDPVKATAVCRFFERILVHPKERLAPFLLIPWQRQWLRQIFGTVDEEGMRVIKRAYLELAKKNGKSEIAAGIALYLLIADQEPAAEIYLAATAKEQAGIVFRVAAAMVEASPVLRRELKVLRSTKRIVKRNDVNSFLAAVSADGGVQDGINPHGVIIDELHRWKTGKSHELLDVLTKSTIARRQPLIVEITTAGSTQDESPLAWLEHERTVAIAKGLFSDPSFLGRIYAADPDDDPMLPATWAKANPSLDINGGFLRSSVLARAAKEAKDMPQLMPGFKRYHLGIWSSTETEWMPLEAWKACGGERRPIIERACYLGLDLSERTDLTSLVLLFPDADGTFDVLPFFWMAKDRVRERELGDRVPYATWASQGFLELTEGDVIDLRDVKRKIAWAADVFQVMAVAFDPAHALQLSIELTEEVGVTCIPVPQRYTHMSEPTKQLLAMTLQGRFRHENHPLLNWNMSCLRVRSDGNDSVRPVKPNRFQSSKRVDGAVAMILALSRAMFHRPSVYETRGIVSG